MGVVNKLKSAIGGTADEREPSHRCVDCGEEYFTEVSTDIHECHSCGGVNVEAV